MAPPVNTGPAPIVASSCGPNGCDTGCCDTGFSHKLRCKLHGMFSHGGNDSCGTCDTCGSSGHGHHFRHTTTSSCNTCNSCDSCGSGHGHGGGFLTRLRGLFHHRGGDCGCCEGGSGCANGACAPSGAPGMPTAPGTERIDAPKKMPNVEKVPAPKSKQSEVRIENQPSAIPPIAAPQVITPPVTVIPQAPTAPSLEVAPIPAPRVDGDRRDPF